MDKLEGVLSCCLRYKINASGFGNEVLPNFAEKTVFLSFLVIFCEFRLVRIEKNLRLNFETCCCNERRFRKARGKLIPLSEVKLVVQVLVVRSIAGCVHSGARNDAMMLSLTEFAGGCL